MCRCFVRCEPGGLRWRGAFFGWLVLASFAWGQPYDLLLQGARVIDPKNGVDAVRDVAIRQGRIATVDERIDPAQARQVIELRGLIVTPAAIDIHTHLFHTTNIPGVWAGDNSVAPDAFSFRSCATTFVDAGSAGWRTFEYFRQTVVDRAETRVFAFINIAGLGMMTDYAEQADFDPEAVAHLARKHRDVVVGIKTAHYQKPDWASVEAALEAGRKAGLPVMVDFGFFLPERPYWQLVIEKLRPGDISTHMYRASVPWVDGNGKVFRYLWEARRRGVKFDVGHGGGSFVFRNAVPAVQQGFYPDSISTDLHTGSMNAGMMDLPTTMSKFLVMGMPLAEIIRAVTWTPANMIGHPELGHLSPGAAADIAVWRIEEGNFGYKDAAGGRLAGRQRLHCEMTFKDGKLVWDWNARAATSYRELPPDYGIRKGIDHIILPPPQLR